MKYAQCNPSWNSSHTKQPVLESIAPSSRTADVSKRERERKSEGESKWAKRQKAERPKGQLKNDRMAKDWTNTELNWNDLTELDRKTKLTKPMNRTI